MQSSLAFNIYISRVIHANNAAQKSCHNRLDIFYISYGHATNYHLNNQGAGPSGLVTAKTLLHGYPSGTFAPTIFEKRHAVGGLWPRKPENDTATGPVNPLMRTNLSRYTVAFSDLAWESVIEDSAEIPMFPQAWQVGRYLEKYTERFLPRGLVRLGERVVRTIRATEEDDDDDDDVEERWTIEWITDIQEQQVKSEQFDFLVVASGYFSSPHIPNIPGLPEFKNRTIHSSSLHDTKDIQHLLQEQPDMTTGKVVVVGGSMSGAEAASTLALHLSSTSLQSRANYQVHHICTRPFWTVPTYLPHETPDSSSGKKKISFLPLDLVMYDLARRPPGPIEYALGPVSSQQVQKVNSYFSSLLGSDYEKYGKIRGRDEKTSQPPWVAIGNDYAEYVRSGTISTTIGRVSAVHNSSRDSNLARIDIALPGGQTKTLDDVTTIVLATGFTPYNSLSYLPRSVLHTLEYSENDPFFPLILDGKGTSNADIPDIGFVGFYRGPYWGVMEMQARLLAKNWTQSPESEPELKSKQNGQEKEKETERQSIRNLRNADPHLSRGQFPMGDYIGLMETSARELGMVRTSLAKDIETETSNKERSGPVVPARYTHASKDPSIDMDRDVTLQSLRSILVPEQSQTDATSMAIFRALHGKWRLTRTYEERQTVHGNAIFHPRYPTHQPYDKEYLYEESESESNQHHKEEQPNPTTTKSIYRLQNNPSQILITSCMDTNTDPTPNAYVHISHEITPRRANQPVDDNGNEESISGGYTVHATGTASTALRGAWEYTYAFHFRGVAIVSWECMAVTMGEGAYFVKTVYERD